MTGEPNEYDWSQMNMTGSQMNMTGSQMNMTGSQMNMTGSQMNMTGTKTLRLPTFLREYDKVAQQCAAEGVDFPRYLLRLSELELLDRERRATERRIRQAEVRRGQESGHLRLPGDPILQQVAGAGVGPLRVHRAEGEHPGVGKLGHRKNAHRARPGPGRLPEGLPRPVHHRGVAGARADRSQGRAAPDAVSKAAVQLRAADHRRAGLRAAIQDRRRAAVRGLQPTLRTRRDAGHQQPAVRRMDRGFRIRAADGGAAGPAHPSRPHPGDERRKLPAQGQQAATVPESHAPQPALRRRFAGAASAPA